MKSLGAALLSLSLVAACASLPEATPAGELDLTLREVVASRAYAINPETTEVSFVAGPSPAGLVHGRFAAFDGELTVNDALTGDAVLGTVLDVKSAEMQNEIFRDLLLGPGWFEADVWPEARFEGRLAGWAEDGSGIVKGTMTIRNIAREQAFRLILTCERVETCPERAVGFEGHMVLDRTEFGMTRMPGLIGRDVQITVTGQLIME
ncbi:YceI family protein [Parvularcula marina]|uniref:YceI family protein n=1 Tax=Parvularcula marina TaxID=2292771 RepID=UPI003518C2EE